MSGAADAAALAPGLGGTAEAPGVASGLGGAVDVTAPLDAAGAVAAGGEAGGAGKVQPGAAALVQPPRTMARPMAGTATNRVTTSRI
jgi:hypothetical protein